jgi:hypothetical protein
MTEVHEINDLYRDLFSMFALKATRILLERTLPLNGHRQNRSIQSWVIKALPHQFLGRQQHAWGMTRQGFVRLYQRTALFV